MSTSPPTRRAVRLALTASAARATSAITAAARLAAALQRDLVAAYVRDEDLLRAAALPGAFEIGVFAMGPRPILATDIERALRREALAAERAIGEAARLLGLTWSFEIFQGRAVSIPFEHAAIDEIVVVAQAGLDFPMLYREVHVQARSLAPAPILAIVEPSPASLESVATVLRAIDGAEPLALWSPEADDGGAAAFGPALRELGVPAARPIRPRVITAPLSAASVARVMRELRPALVVIPRALAERLRMELPAALRGLAGTLIFSP